MRLRASIIITIAIVVIAATTAVSVVTARAQGEPSTTAITPAQLVLNVKEHVADVGSVSGELTWKNDVLGLSMPSSVLSKGPGDIAALLSGGSGRLWLQNGKARFEIQGSTGDTTVYAQSTGIWVYDSAKNTATEYTFPARDATGAGENPAESGTSQGGTGSSPSTTDPLTAINDVIQKLAPDATLTVTDQTKVAGQDCYVLSLVPKATNTVFGSLQVAVDSTTWLPLQVQIYAKGAQEAVLSAGFTSISYAKLDDSLFTFTPPAGATVEHKSLSLPGKAAGQTGTAAAGTGSTTQSTTEPATEPATTAEPAPLTLADAATKAGFTPAAAQPSDPALAFAGAYVIPAQQFDLQALLSKLQTGAARSAGSSTSPAAESSTSPAGAPGTSDSEASDMAPLKILQALTGSLPSGPLSIGPTVVERYGQGFGTIVLADAKVPGDLLTWLDQTLSFIPLLSKTTAGSATVHQFSTPLGSVAVWQQSGHLLAAAGSVSSTDLLEFIASVH